MQVSENLSMAKDLVIEFSYQKVMTHSYILTGFNALPPTTFHIITHHQDTSKPGEKTETTQTR